METKDNRFSANFVKNFLFMRNSVRQPWISGSFINSHLTSYDGVTYSEEESLIMYGSYFFLSDTRYEHSRKVFGISDVLANVGGYLASLLAIYGTLGDYINR